MPYPTGPQIPSTPYTLTLTIPFDPEDPANNWMLSAVLGAIYSLSFNSSWFPTEPTFVSQTDAAALALQIYNLMIASH